MIGLIANFTFVFVASFAFFKLCDMLIGLRVAPEVEIGGLDIPEMGALCYPEFVLKPEPEMEHAMATGD